MIGARAVPPNRSLVSTRVDDQVVEPDPDEDLDEDELEDEE